MKLSIIAITLFMYSAVSNANTLQNYINKMRNIVEKNGMCDFAVTPIPYGKQETREELFPGSVLCIGDVSYNKGTMNEKNGCAAFYLDVFHLTTHGLLAYLGPVYTNRKFIVESKTCSNGGFEELMGQKLGPLNDHVSDAFLKAALQVQTVFKPVFVYEKPSSSNKYKTWFDKGREQYLAEQEMKDKKQKK